MCFTIKTVFFKHAGTMQSVHVSVICKNGAHRPNWSLCCCGASSVWRFSSCCSVRRLGWMRKIRELLPLFTVSRSFNAKHTRSCWMSFIEGLFSHFLDLLHENRLAYKDKKTDFGCHAPLEVAWKQSVEVSWNFDGKQEVTKNAK